jgi:hypothetical protein
VAADYADCLDIVRRLVKPERQRLRSDGEFQLRAPLPQKWWVHADYRPALYETIAGMQRVLVVSIVTHHIGMAFVPFGWVYAHRLAVFPLQRDSEFALMQSTLHEVWARLYSSQLETRLNYSPSDCFETFPFPECFAERPWGLGPGAWDHARAALDDVGRRYYEHRQAIMRARGEGLTKTYNRFHAPAEAAADIVELRRLHVEMDHAVLAAYGWEDLALDHGFHETKQGLRFTVSPTARQELLDRLLELNHQRYAAEVAAGLHGTSGVKGKKGRVPAKKGKPAAGGLF